MAALFLKAGKRGFWPLADQGVASVGNILTVALLGRWLTKTDYGVFTVILEALMFLVSFHGALITYPLTVKGAVAPDAKLRHLATTALLLTLILAVPLSLAGLLAGSHFSLLAVAVVSAVSLMFWQMQETLRRGMMSHFRHREAILGDAVSYLGQVLCLFLLFHFRRLTLATALGSIGITSALALLIQVWQVGLARVSAAEVKRTAVTFFLTGRWIALTTLGGTLSLMICGNWTLAGGHGLEQVADFAAVANLLKICNPVLQSIGGLIIPASAKALDRGGMPAASRTAFRMASMAGLVLAFPMLLMLLAPHYCLWLVYKDKYGSAQHAHALQLFVVGYFIVFLSTMISSFLNGVHRTRFTFYGQVAGSIAMFTVLLPMNIVYGWMGYVVGGILQGVAQVAVLAFFVTRAMKLPAAAADDASIEAADPIEPPGFDPIIKPEPHPANT